METVNVTKKMLNDWIMEQPADRPVNFDNAGESQDCGCLFIEYGRDRFPDKDKLHAGLSTLYNDFDANKEILANMPYWFDQLGRPSTFGELQEAIRKRDKDYAIHTPHPHTDPNNDEDSSTGIP